MQFNPSINYEHWKTKEDGLLLQGIKEHGENWEIIAFEIFRNARNPDQCRYRYEGMLKDRRITPSRQNSQITPIKEKRKMNLSQIHPQCNEKKCRNKEELAQLVEPRIPFQHLVLHPTISPHQTDRVSRLWSIKEDELLLNGIRAYRNDWKKISSTFFNAIDHTQPRSSTQCKAHYYQSWMKKHPIDEIQKMESPIRIYSDKTGGVREIESWTEELWNIAIDMIESGEFESLTSHLH